MNWTQQSREFWYARVGTRTFYIRETDERYRVTVISNGGGADAVGAFDSMMEAQRAAQDRLVALDVSAMATTLKDAPKEEPQ